MILHDPVEIARLNDTEPLTWCIMSGGTMLHVVEMDVIHVRRVVAVVADRVFPVSALPDAGLALARERGAAIPWMRDAVGERRLDRPPAVRDVGIGGRQGP